MAVLSQDQVNALMRGLDDKVEFQQVEIPALIYPCWAYAFARVGKEFSLEWLKRFATKVMRPYNVHDLRPGDLIIWDVCETKRIKGKYTTCITQAGRVLYRPVNYDCCVAVCEADGKVSDCAAFYGGCLPFIIRMYFLDDRSERPARMIKYGDLPA